MSITFVFVFFIKLLITLVLDDIV